MIENVSVNKAIENGKGVLKFVPIVIILSSFVISVYMFKELKLSLFFSIATVLFGVFISFMYWRFAVTKWKIWAYENVINTNELKNKAIKNRLIGEDGSWFQKMEIRNYEQRQKLKKLDKRNNKEDIYHDTFDIPKETKINFSKVRIYINLFISAFMILSVLFLLNEKINMFYLVIFPLVGIFIAIPEIKKMLQKEPSLIINSIGIKLPRATIYNWKLIENETITSKVSHEHVNYYLSFQVNNKTIEVKINELNIEEEKLERLLQVYRLRYNKLKPSES